MKTIKKAQTGVKQKPAAKPKGPRRTTSGMWVDEDKFRPPFDVEYADEVKPKAKPKKKAKSGAKFDLNKDGKTTFKDVLIGRGVLPKTAKKGATVKKAQNGAPVVKYKDNPGYKALMEKGKSKPKAAKPTTKPIMKSGGSMKKCRYGCK